jgi:sugar phosphate isomerase/epimerase
MKRVKNMKDKDVIYVTTGGFSTINAAEVTENYFQSGISCVELSAGKYCPDIEARLEPYKDKCSFILHNYFPVPEIPFVLNLASLNDEVFAASYEHVRSAIAMAGRLESKYYSFHAGFLIDPKPSELGQRIGKRAFFDRDESAEKFVNAVNSLSKFAATQNVQLLVENNVCSPRNFDQFKEDPFLLSDPNGVKELFHNLDPSVRMLLDVAHLIVSANTLDYDTDDFITQCHEYIGGYHLSDNCGTVDSNEAFDDDSYFWKYLKNDLDYYSVEVYNEENVKLVELVNLVKEKLHK